MKKQYHPTLIQQAKHRYSYLCETIDNISAQLNINKKDLMEILGVKGAEKKRSYWVKDGPNGTCAVCGSKLDSCHIGSYCSNQKCSYVDGTAEFTESEAKGKYANIILKSFHPGIGKA